MDLASRPLLHPVDRVVCRVGSDRGPLLLDGHRPDDQPGGGFESCIRSMSTGRALRVVRRTEHRGQPRPCHPPVDLEVGGACRLCNRRQLLLDDRDRGCRHATLAGARGSDREGEEALMPVTDLVGVRHKVGQHPRGPRRLGKRVFGPPSPYIGATPRQASFQDLKAHHGLLLAQPSQEAPPSRDSKVLGPFVGQDEAAAAHRQHGCEGRGPHVVDQRCVRLRSLHHREAAGDAG